jgi:hypothetical protein
MVPEHRERLVAHHRLEALRPEIEADDPHPAMLARHTPRFTRHLLISR